MPHRFDCQSSHAAAYLARPAERLVLEGYRHAIAAAVTGGFAPWQAATGLYRGILGPRGSTAAMQALAEFIATLGRCAACPLRTFESDSRHVCRDEVLVLGLVAGIQNGDDEAAELCLAALSCATRCDEVAFAAGAFALVLRGLDKTLLPIPAPVVRDILDRSRAPRGGYDDSPTLH
ncbi:MAG: hypothetical protein WAU86_23055 [Oricola sp.]